MTVSNQKKTFQITSFRKDVQTFGRAADIELVENIEEDAKRRDFTINAFYCSYDGQIIDPLGNLEDLNKIKLDFIGDPETRIKEDYLRIYRYFRFLGLFDQPDIDDTTQLFVEKYIHESLVVLTNDVIRQEVLKMFNMPFPLNCFFRSHDKFKWVEILKEHFIKTNYELGLKKCLNKIDSIIN